MFWEGTVSKSVPMSVTAVNAVAWLGSIVLSEGAGAPYTSSM